MAIASKPTTATVFGTVNTGDYLFGTAGNDIITGGGAATIIYSKDSDGLDTMEGSAGNDSYIVNNTGDIIIENAYQGIDTIYTSVSYTLPSEVENSVAAQPTASAGLVLVGNTKDNGLDGSQNAISDTLKGMEGNDIYIANANDQVLEGKIVSNTTTTTTDYTDTGGIDTIISTATVNISPLITAATQQSNMATGVTQDKILGAAYIENVLLKGTTTANILGNTKDNILTGNDAANSITGGSSGNDTLDGGIESSAKTDTLVGGAGNDVYIIRNSSDIINETITGSAGTDLVKASTSYVLPLNVENLNLIGVAAINGTGNTLANTITANDAVNTINASDGNDSINSYAGNDSIDAGTGNDLITAGLGKDIITAGTGNDIIKFASGTTDTAATTSSIAYMDWYKDLTLNASSADRIDLTVPVAAIGATVSGAVSESSFTTNMDTLLKTSGKGFVQMAAGIDAAIVNATFTPISGTASDKSFLAIDLNSSGSFDTNDFIIDITGSTLTSLTSATFITSALTVSGTSNNDVLEGRAGNDTITGGAGKDKISVGGGNNIIRFASGITDSYALGNSTIAIDWYNDLNLNGNEGDGIALTVSIAKVGATSTGVLNERSFVTDMNTLLSSSGKGFVQYSGGIDAAIVAGTSGTLLNKKFLAVDLDSSGTFTVSDFVIEISNSSITSLSSYTFMTSPLTVKGTSASDTLYGGVANDNITGDAGNDSLIGGAGNDSIAGGTSTVITGTGNDTLSGGAGNDSLTGGDGNDSIIAGSGNDTIIAGLGRDNIALGEGNDVIRFATGNADSFAVSNTITNVDQYMDLVFDSSNADKIDLTVFVTKVGTAVSGTLNQTAFVANMNTLLSSSGKGFVQYSGGIDAAVVTATAGDLSNRVFLAVDLDSNGTFTTTDFVIEITGSVITSLTTTTFI